MSFSGFPRGARGLAAFDTSPALFYHAETGGEAVKSAKDA
jgi:hypothetical protein